MTLRLLYGSPRRRSSDQQDIISHLLSKCRKGILSFELNMSSMKFESMLEDLWNRSSIGRVKFQLHVYVEISKLQWKILKLLNIIHRRKVLWISSPRKYVFIQKNNSPCYWPDVQSLILYATYLGSQKEECYLMMSFCMDIIVWLSIWMFQELHELRSLCITVIANMWFVSIVWAIVVWLLIWRLWVRSVG